MTKLDGMLQLYVSNIGIIKYMHNTNTLLTQFSSYGIIFGVTYLYSIWIFVKSICKGNGQFILVLGACIILLFSENFDTTLLFGIVIFIGLEIKRMVTENENIVDI